uniref:Retrotransposon gag domain-containing protein n=1 Tax=Photinus pyralis TaxID=7054 RepID=A0A1Y1N9Z0_PHOPY
MQILKKKGLKKDKKCKSIIVQCVANTHLEYIKDKHSAFQMWGALQAVFQRKGIASQIYLRKKLLTMKFDKGTLEEYFLKFEGTVRELKSVGAKLEDVDVVCHLLITLPSE